MFPILQPLVSTVDIDRVHKKGWWRGRRVERLIDSELNLIRQSESPKLITKLDGQVDTAQGSPILQRARTIGQADTA